MATTAKTFRTKRDAEDRARRTEDEMVRGAYIQRAPAERMTAEDGLKRYLAEVSPYQAPGISRYAAHELDAVAATLNRRPRKNIGL